MPDWTKSMQQTFEYYTVDPETWCDDARIDNVIKSTINWDSSVATLGSATIDITDSVGECYIRIYLVTIQNGVTEKFPLGTFLVQSPSSSFDGKVRSVSMDAYTPLLELKENLPPIGYSILKNENIMSRAYMLTRENARAPAVETEKSTKLEFDFIANTDDTWLTFLTDLIAQAKYTFMLDEMGRILYAPKQDAASLRPVWTYTDDNVSILYPELDIKHDLFDIPNVVEVLYSMEGIVMRSTATNKDANSPTSTINRGRKITHRISNPSFPAIPTQEQLNEYAEQVLRDLSTIEYTVSYTHAYCPVRVGDCVRINYNRAGLTDVKAMVISQNIKCEPGCPVSEKAVITTKLWR